VDAAELVFAGSARQAELVRTGAVSSRELVEACLERIARLDPLLNAFRIVLAERALAEAAQADARRAAGDERPLLGVPIAVKDVTDVAGELTTHGTSAHGGPAERDSELVRLLRAAGAVIVGKTHTPELAQWAMTESATFGMTRNPWRQDRTPGGSSGGAAAAVAAGMVGAAHGTDGLGSIRIPAACCGLFGLKPQRGRIPLAPDEDHWHGLSVAGPLARSVLDAALFMDAVAGSDGATGTSAIGGGDADAAGGGLALGTSSPAGPFAAAARRRPDRLRIACALNSPPGLRRPHEWVAQAVRDTADVLRGLGHEVRERRIDYSTAGIRAVGRYLRGIHDDAASLPHARRLEHRTRSMARLGSLIPPQAIARERAREAARARRVGSALEGHDLLMMPVLLRQPAELGSWEGRGAARTVTGMLGFAGPLTSPWNMTGQPAAAIPAGFDPDGLPLSVQLVARPHDETTLLSLAAELEAERGWADLRPPVG
jgi:amidase